MWFHWLLKRLSYFLNSFQQMLLKQEAFVGDHFEWWAHRASSNSQILIFIIVYNTYNIL